MAKGGKFGPQGKYVRRRAKGKMGELVTMLCFEGGLTASFAEQVAMARWWPTVVAYMPLVWACAGLDKLCICKADAAHTPPPPPRPKHSHRLASSGGPVSGARCCGKFCQL
jgi:hypothetical protein